uniref:NAD(P)-binding domain-containing protein n=1 Tax=Salix viminalis TaxID=40686 RepID=A0A6N2LF03_SALVM
MKKAIISRLLHSQSPPFLKPHYYRDRSLFAARNGRFLSTGSEKVDGSSKLEEAERVEFTPPKEKLLVLGGNGFVGSHICIEALAHGLDVSSLSRSGKSSLHDPWANDIVWHQGDLLSPDSLGNAMNGVTSVISCVGGFGSKSYMYDINGTANINAIRAASEQGVILRPGFIHGTRRVGSLHLPLSIIGAPLEMVLRHAKLLTHLPLIGPLLIPPVNVTSVAKVAVRAAVDPAFPRCVVDVYGILQHSQRNPA